MTSAAARRLSAVDPELLERELARLWTDLGHAGVAAEPGEAVDEAGLQPVLRACALNLLIFAPDLRAAAEAAQAVASLTGRHPCRAVLLVAEPAAQDGPELEAQVSALCRLAGSGRSQVCCEVISVYSRGPDAAGKLAGAVMPLLVPDLPVVAWWDATLPEHGAGTPNGVLFERLADLADRMIVDSALGVEGSPAPSIPRQPAPAVGVIAKLLARRDLTLVWSDLSWARLLAWREAVASAFDPPELAALLPLLETVQVRFQDGQALDAWLFVGWLGALLGWDLGLLWRPSDGNWIQRNSRGTLMVSVLADDTASSQSTNVDSSSLLAAELSASLGGGQRATISVRREESNDGSLALVFVQAPHRPVWQCAVPLRVLPTGHLLADMLDQPGPDRVFERSVRWVAQLQTSRA